MKATRSRARNLWLAAGLAVLAGVLTLVYLGRGNGGNAHAADGPTVSVLVATRDLPVGTPASQALAKGWIVLRHVPAEAVAGDALPSAKPLAGEVVVQPVYSGDQISAHRFGPSGAAGAGASLTGSMRILQVPGNANQLLAGTLQDGDRVDVFGSVRQGQQQQPVAGVVLRNVLVLHAPPSSGSSSTSASAPQLSATVELTDEQAARLFYVMENGNWSFVLRPASHAGASTVVQRDADNVLLKG